MRRLLACDELREGARLSSDRKRRRVVLADASDSEAESTENAVLIYTHNSHVYFTGDVTPASMFLLCKELRQAAHGLRTRGALEQPLYLHVTTDGGDVSAAFACVDCIKTLGTPVHSVVEGFVASAGTLITLSAAKRFIGSNAYMMIHQVSSGVWGKMNSIRTQFENLTKLMDHLVQFYKQHAKMSKSALAQLLSTDVELNAAECIERGLADAVYRGDGSVR